MYKLSFEFLYQNAYVIFINWFLETIYWCVLIDVYTPAGNLPGLGAETLIFSGSY